MTESSPKLIVANFKKTGSAEMMKSWVSTIGPIAQGLMGLAHIVVCPPDLYLDKMKFQINKQEFPEYISVGAQNFDSSDDSNVKITGQTTAEMVSDFAKYVILGHSEVRAWDKANKKYLGDTPDVVNKKIDLAIKAKLIPIVCISDIQHMRELTDLRKAYPNYDGIIGFEPIGAVGTGKPMDPEDANEVALKILEMFPNAKVIYGGSVKADKAREFFAQPNLSGVLVGNASSDTKTFAPILQAFPTP